MSVNPFVEEVYKRAFFLILLAFWIFLDLFYSYELFGIIYDSLGFLGISFDQLSQQHGSLLGDAAAS